jgi:hypothetical protein
LLRASKDAEDSTIQILVVLLGVGGTVVVIARLKIPPAIILALIASPAATLRRRPCLGSQTPFALFLRALRDFAFARRSICSSICRSFMLLQNRDNLLVAKSLALHSLALLKRPDSSSARINLRGQGHRPDIGPLPTSPAIGQSTPVSSNSLCIRSENQALNLLFASLLSSSAVVSARPAACC